MKQRINVDRSLEKKSPEDKIASDGKTENAEP
jgi:hypothetical protein